MKRALCCHYVDEVVAFLNVPRSLCVWVSSEIHRVAVLWAS